MQNAAIAPPLDQFIGKVVRLAVTPDGIEIRDATDQELLDTQNERRPGK